MDRVEGQTLPYRAEYSKSARAACKKCKENIPKDVLRMAVMTQSRFFDGMQPNWHHFDCFFGRCRPKAVTDIAHFESLRWDDQEKIRNKIESNLDGGGAPVEPAKGKGKAKAKKRNLQNGSSKTPFLHDFTVEYAKSNKSKCKLCEDFIPKNDVRISKKDYESETARQYGPTERWHHVDCFIKARDELEFWSSGKDLPGFNALSPEDQIMLKKKIEEKDVIPASDVADGVPPAKQSKKEKNEESEDKEKMKEQNKKMFKYRDELKKMSKPDLITLMEYNNQQIPTSPDSLLDRLADGMTFGALKKCEKCNGGQLAFRSGVGYQCLGYLSEWAKCEDQQANPKRQTFSVPQELKDEYPFLAAYKGKVERRRFTVAQPHTSSQPSSTVTMRMLPLHNMAFVIHKSDTKAAQLKKKIEELGGTVEKQVNEKTAAVISLPDEVSKPKLNKAIKEAKEKEIQVVTEDLLASYTVNTTRPAVLEDLKSKNIASWGADPEKRILALPADLPDGKLKSVYGAKKSESIYKSDKSGTVQKLQLKGGLAVDPDSLLEHVAHVYKKKQDVYSVVCSLTDVQTQRNSFYKLQILESDSSKKYWLFRSWGRIGTTIGGTKTEQYSTLEEVIDQFKLLFEDKTGNTWEGRHNFTKVPGKMMMLEVTYGDDSKIPKSLIASKVKSNLPKPVADLICLIFDVEEMKKTMLEFELDLNKMPLGKLSQKQIKDAFSVLTDLQKLTSNAAVNKQLMIEYTNRFYTLVPHDFGVNNPTMLDNDDIIKQKIEMLNNLMDIEIAYKILQGDETEGESPIDTNYKKLQADISVLDKKSDEFNLIKTYTENTHAKTHSNYKLVIEEVFKIERNGENNKYKKFKKLDNKKLLWHGSRLTNFAGILSQGLRIAPPEAPATGYMFGKGVYFADMVSKSANYCFTSNSNPTGLLLLCEVALGQMYELPHAKYVEKLPAGKHSVKGLGKTYPDPKEIVKIPTGAEVPLGKPITDNKIQSSLLYNEYIVYDTAQIKIEYLLKTKFKYSY